MKTFLFLNLIVIAISLSTFAGSNLSGKNEKNKVIQINMLNSGKDGIMVFEPSFVKANVGDTVEFIPTDSSHGSNSYFVPDGAKAWKGEPNKKVSTKLTKEGVYLYECSPHSQMAMVGVIQVGTAGNLKAAKKAAAELKKKFIMNKDRLDQYLKKVK